MCILRPGFLFAASEFGNHALYQFQSIGGETEVGSYQPVLFMPRQVRNLVQTDDVESLMPIVDMRVENLLGEEAPQIFALCGRGRRSSLRILRASWSGCDGDGRVSDGATRSYTECCMDGEEACW
jgi:splicing factor 3B subunit 3